MVPPVPIPNTEVKLPTPFVLVSDKTRNIGAVSLNFHMVKNISKKSALKQIENFFENISNKNPRDIKKVRKLAMSFNIKLGEKKKLFCKKCLKPYENPKIRIKNKLKILTCENCGYVSRWKVI